MSNRECVLRAAEEEAVMGPWSVVIGLVALALVLAVVGLAFTALKWLLIVAAVVFMLGVVRAMVGARGGPNPGGPGAR
jgi:hypothetical protein